MPPPGAAAGRGISDGGSDLICKFSGSSFLMTGLGLGGVSGVKTILHSSLFLYRNFLCLTSSG